MAHYITALFCALSPAPLLVSHLDTLLSEFLPWSHLYLIYRSCLLMALSMWEERGYYPDPRNRVSSGLRMCEKNLVLKNLNCLLRGLLQISSIIASFETSVPCGIIQNGQSLTSKWRQTRAFVASRLQKQVSHNHIYSIIRSIIIRVAALS